MASVVGNRAIDPAVVVGELVRRAVVAVLGEAHAAVDPQVHRSHRADLQADLAISLAKLVKRPPRELAEQLVAALPAAELAEIVERVEVAGAGYLNITLRASWIADAVARLARAERLGVALAARRERIVIDYSAPNVAKEMHVGHLRSTIIGDAFARVLELRGHTVIRQNHLGDWGTPFGMLIEHLIDLGDEAARREMAMGQLSAFYKAARKKFDGDDAFAERSRLRVVALQAGDEPTLELWRELVALSTRYFQSIYERLGVTLTPSDICAESFYNDRLPALADELAASGRAVTSDGALCLFPQGFVTKEGQPLPLIIRKRDGGYGYATTDLAALRYRLDELGATRLLYVVGATQAMHLGMVFQAARELGWLAPPAQVEHVSFGNVLDPETKRPLKSRSGDAALLVDLIDAAIARAIVVIEDKASDPKRRGPHLSPEERAEIARIVGIGAIKYADLFGDRVKDYFFELQRMVKFEGNTAGYAQYAHARIRTLVRASGQPSEAVAGAAIDVGDRGSPERALVAELLELPTTIEAVERTLQPHHLVHRIYAIASAFTTFYDMRPILDDKLPAEVRASRLALAHLTGRMLAGALGLLGIDVPERM